MRITALVIIPMLLSFGLVLPASAAEEEKAVLITGATSGIGRMAAERLAEAGYFVYAGARKQEDMDALNAIDNVMAVRLDVTKQADIDAAVELIEAEGRGLWGLVNNAGINIIDPLIETDLPDIEFLFDVNVFGIVRVTKAFAPLIIESGGRIVNISSISGILSGGLTGYGMYTMSKHAVEAYTDQLAFEMVRFGVAVSAIEPGNFNSEIGISRCQRMARNEGMKDYVYYAEDMGFYNELCRKRLAGEDTGFEPAPEPEPVAAAIEHALFAAEPKEHYLVTASDEETRLTLGKAMEEAAHLNLGHEHSLSRDELVDILDNELAIAAGVQPRGMPGFYDDPAPSGDD